jgi:hypothetical protein
MVKITVQDILNIAPHMTWAQAVAWHESNAPTVYGVAQRAAHEYTRKLLSLTTLEPDVGINPADTVV